MNFVQEYQSTQVEAGHVQLFWLGQAGFLLKTASGRAIAIDPYFSDHVMRTLNNIGFKRMTPPPCAADDIVLDVLLISHEHGDHFDTDAIGDMMKNGKTQLYTNCVVYDEMKKLGYDMNRVHMLKKGECVDIGECKLTPMDCDHGELAPEALGFMLDFGFTRVYYAGDTAPTWDRLTVPMQIHPEVAILPINGAFGNLDGVQAAEYAGKLGCKTVVPCHFWTFPLHHGDPQQIIDSIGEKAPNCELKLLRQGESFCI